MIILMMMVMTIMRRIRRRERRSGGIIRERLQGSKMMQRESRVVLYSRGHYE